MLFRSWVNEDVGAEAGAGTAGRGAAWATGAAGRGAGADTDGAALAGAGVAGGTAAGVTTGTGAGAAEGGKLFRSRVRSDPGRWAGGVVCPDNRTAAASAIIDMR